MMKSFNMYSRRDFGKLALAGLPLSAFALPASAAINSKIDGVEIGAQSYSFRDLSLDDAIKAMADIGLGYCELFAPHIEHMGSPALSPNGGGRRDPVARKATEEAARKWRLTAPLSVFEDVRKKFDAAGIKLVGYNYSFRDNYSDEEIDRGFRMAKALGVDVITASSTVSVAKRVAPYADKHKIKVAFHGHSNLKDPNEFAKPESFAEALKLSSQFRINLDIGHFTAAGYDPVPYIQEQHKNIVLLHLKDRKKSEGANVPWGEGDTPIKQVLQLLKTKKYPIPALIEYEYKGSGSSPEEVRKCFEYCKRALA
jgi:sugar phosphate isomerase/epimerase